jgi:hypothetical protein
MQNKVSSGDNVLVPEKGGPERVEIPEAEPLRLECEHFLHSFTNGSRTQTDGAEGLRVLRVLNAAQRSLNNDGCSVELTHTGSLQKKIGLGRAILPFDNLTAVNKRELQRLPAN